MKTLSFAETRRALAAGIRARVACLLVGPPGIGKSAVVAQAAADVGLPLHVLIGSNCDPTDIAGFPFVDSGHMRRALVPAIQACVDAPGLLFLDEATSVPSSVQAPLMRLYLELIAGDTRLHPGSAVVAACNPPDQCPGGVELTAAQINRVVVVEFCPNLKEISGFFMELGAPGSKLREEAADFAATMDADSSLVCLTPPRAAIDAAQPFASPRAWERGLRVWAEMRANSNTADGDDIVAYTLLCGAVGQDAAVRFHAVRKLRAHLPTADEILADPTKARVPDADQRDRQIAALGLLARVAQTDKWAAWTYAVRLSNEVAIAATRHLVNARRPNASLWKRQGEHAEVSLLARAHRVL